MTRDPRMDPQPGDVIRQGRQDIAVIATRQDMVYFSRADANKNFSTVGFCIPIWEWRDQAKDAEVVNG